MAQNKKGAVTMTATEYREANPKLFPKVKAKKIDQGKVSGEEEVKKGDEDGNGSN